MPERESMEHLESKPSNDDWLKLRERAEVAISRYKQVWARVEERVGIKGIDTNHIADYLGNLGAVSSQAISHFGRTFDYENELQTYTGVASYVTCLEKYLDLLDDFPEFFKREMAEDGPAFPDLMAKYATKPPYEEAKKDGYESYRDGYIYEAEKRLRGTATSEPEE